MTAVALTGACDSGEPTASPSSKPSTSRPSSGEPTGVPDGKAAKAILDQAFVSREEISSGYGRLEPRFGNTARLTCR